MSNTTADRNTTEIKNQRIVWWLRGEGVPTELDDASIEHVGGMVSVGHREGELYVTGADGVSEFRGWWQLEVAAQGTATKSHNEVVNDIAQVLREADGKLLETIYNQVCSGRISYMGDSVYEVTPAEF